MAIHYKVFSVRLKQQTVSMQKMREYKNTHTHNQRYHFIFLYHTTFSKEIHVQIVNKQNKQQMKGTLNEYSPKIVSHF